MARRMAASGAVKPDRALALVEHVSTTTSLGVPLLTVDARLARAAGLTGAVEVIS